MVLCKSLEDHFRQHVISIRRYRLYTSWRNIEADLKRSMFMSSLKTHQWSPVLHQFVCSVHEDVSFHKKLWPQAMCQFNVLLVAQEEDWMNLPFCSAEHNSYVFVAVLEINKSWNEFKVTLTTFLSKLAALHHVRKVSILYVLQLFTKSNSEAFVMSPGVVKPRIAR